MNLSRHLSTEEIESDVALINELAESQPYIDEWIGYDLDKTLFKHDKWEGPLSFSEPIPAMIAHLKANVDAGKKVKIFTARVSYADERINDAARFAIQTLMKEHVGQVLEVTCVKDVGMRTLYDDRARQVIENTGVVVEAPKNPPGTVAGQD